MTTNHSWGLLGTGALGSALARAALARGLTTSVWNRTPARAEPLVALGATAQTSAADLVASTRVVVAVLSTYADVRAVLDLPLDGRVVVNLSSGSPADAASMADEVTARGARYLDGAAMGGTRLVGDPSAMYFFSGDAEALETARPILECFGTPLYLGADPAMASAYDTATLGMILGFLTAGYQALTLLNRQRIDSQPFVDVMRQYWPFVLDQFDRHARELRDGDIVAADGTVEVYLGAWQLLIDTANDVGVDTTFSDAVATLLRRTVERGHGEDGLASLAGQFEMVTQP